VDGTDPPSQDGGTDPRGARTRRPGGRRRRGAAADARRLRPGLRQIADDLLDAEGDEAAVGKRVGKDAGRGKLTYPTVLGAAESRRLADELADEAATTVAGLGHPAAELVALARWVVARDH
jgi:hypothetical protein